LACGRFLGLSARRLAFGRYWQLAKEKAESFLKG